MKNYYLKLFCLISFSIGLMSLSAQVINQNCSEAFPIGEGVYFVDEITDGEGAVNLCYDTGGTNAVWYEYTPTFTGSALISSHIDPELTDTRLSVYIGDCDALSCFGYDDDSGEAFTSTLILDVVEGESVYLEWDDRWTTNGFQFIVVGEDSGIEGCTDPEASN